MKNTIKYCHIPDEDDKSFHFDHIHIFWHEQISLHQQKTWELSYVISGKGMRVIGDTMETFSPGEVILIPPNVPHYWAFDKSEHDNVGKIENITLIFSADLLRKAKYAFEDLIDPIGLIEKQENAISFGGKTLEKLQKILVEMKTESTIERLSSLIKVIALISSPEIAATVGHRFIEDRKTKKLQRIYLYVMDNFQNHITLNHISRHIGMERSAFCTFFKKMTGKSFFSFLTDYRINVACDMLVKTSKTVTEICIASGFRDVPYFNRVFKELKQMTPTLFRAKSTTL